LVAACPWSRSDFRRPSNNHNYCARARTFPSCLGRQALLFYQTFPRSHLHDKSWADVSTLSRKTFTRIRRVCTSRLGHAWGFVSPSSLFSCRTEIAVGPSGFVMLRCIWLGHELSKWLFVIFASICLSVSRSLSCLYCVLEVGSKDPRAGAWAAFCYVVISQC
jgi:hypothetical protein